jgi:hypothetical protein
MRLGVADRHFFGNSFSIVSPSHLIEALIARTDPDLMKRKSQLPNRSLPKVRRLKSMPSFILEVVQYIKDDDERRVTGAGYSHVGYMQAHFRTKHDAASYYDRHNPHMRGLHAHTTWESDYDPTTNLAYIVRRHYGVCLTIPPFDPGDVPVANKMLKEMFNKQSKDIHQIDDSFQFWTLMDQLSAAKSGFYHNRVALLDAYMRGHLYTMHVVETDELFGDGSRGALAEWLGSSPSFILMPAFCYVEDGRCHMIWVREDLRRLGIGSLFVKGLDVKQADVQLPESAPFWGHHGIETPVKA